MRPLFLAVLLPLGVAAEAPIKFTAPVANQVIQREGYVPSKAGPHEPGGPELGRADVRIAAEFAATEGETFQARVVALDDSFGAGFDWRDIKGTRTDSKWTGSIRVPAGGWYRLELRATSGGKVYATGSVEPIGVGEVFLIAGQSYAEAANDELLKVEEKRGRIVLFHHPKGTWATAHDTVGGTIWPPTGDFLVPILRVPVGFVNVAVGGTASRQWLPGETLFKNAATVGKAVGRFRAVLWQQGESDVIEKVSTEQYVKNVTAIRNGLVKEWGFAPPWLAAKSTLHPTVYNDPDGEQRIRTAIDQLWKTDGFRPGPDTDVLAGENRGGPKTKRHFTGIGQRRAGLMWFAAIFAELNRE